MAMPDGVEQGLAVAPESMQLLSFGFNQDFSCFVCGTTAGFRVFTTSPVTEAHRREGPRHFEEGQRVTMVAMLFKTNIFAMVTTSDEAGFDSATANKVRLWDDQKGQFVGELRSRTAVRGVVLRRDIIAMVCEYAIYVYTCDKFRVIMHLTTNANPRGLCAIAPYGSPWMLCCPGQSTGAVRVQIGQDDQSTHVFTAHQTALAALSLNSCGSLVATASENGTVVKVFKASDGELLYRFRRGARPAIISCLAFRQDDAFLGVASSTSTVHVFRLSSGERRKPPGVVPTPSGGVFLGPLPTVAPVLPPAPEAEKPRPEQLEHLEDVLKAVKAAVPAEVLPRYFSDEGSFATFRVPDADATGTPFVDMRHAQSGISGPQLAFHGAEARLSVLHHNGTLYETAFNECGDGSAGAQACRLVAGTTWFAARHDFRLLGTNAEVAMVAGGADDDDDAEPWSLI